MGSPMYAYVSKLSALDCKSAADLVFQFRMDRKMRLISPRSAHEAGDEAHHCHRKPTAKGIQAEEVLLRPGEGSSFKQPTLSTGQQDFSVLAAQGYITKTRFGDLPSRVGTGSRTGQLLRYTVHVQPSSNHYV